MKISEGKIRKLIRKKLIKEYQAGQKSDTDYRSRLSSRSDKDDEFETGSASISSGIQWGDGESGSKRKAAWEALQPFLPNGTSLTSCYRSQEDQERIIKNKAVKFKYAGDPNDLDAMHAFITKKPKPGQVVARNVGTGHGGKNNTGAFDLSGANLDQIWSGVERANEMLKDRVKFAPLNGAKGYRSIIERENNAVHVHFNLKDINMSNIAKDKKESEKAASVYDLGVELQNPSYKKDSSNRDYYVYEDANSDDEYWIYLEGNSLTDPLVVYKLDGETNNLSEIFQEDSLDIFEKIQKKLSED